MERGRGGKETEGKRGQEREREREGRGVCVRAHASVRGTVWCVVGGLRGVLIGPLIAWNGTNKCVRVLFAPTVWRGFGFSSVFWE